MTAYSMYLAVGAGEKLAPFAIFAFATDPTYAR